MNKKLRANADFVADEFLAFPHIKLSNSQNLKMDGGEFDVLLSDFVQQMPRKNEDNPDIHFT